MLLDMLDDSLTAALTPDPDATISVRIWSADPWDNASTDPKPALTPCRRDSLYTVQELVRACTERDRYVAERREETISSEQCATLFFFLFLLAAHSLLTFA